MATQQILMTKTQNNALLKRRRQTISKCIPITFKFKSGIHSDTHNMTGSLYTQVPSDPAEPKGSKRPISLWSHLTFAWLNRIFALGNTRPLEQTDLVRAAAQRDSKELYIEISKLWASEARSTSPRLLRAVARLFGAKDYAVGFLCLVVYAYVLVSQPIFLNFLLRELTAVSPNTAWIGLFLAGISLSGIVIPLVNAGLFYRGIVIGSHVSTALIALVYKKVSWYEDSCTNYRINFASIKM